MKEEVKLATYASGYRRLYGNDEDEIRALTGEAAREARGGIATADWNNPVVHWWPSTEDFAVEARRRGQTVPVANFEQVLAAIRRCRHLISVVYCFGHGAKGELQFGGGQKLTREMLPSLVGQDVSKYFVDKGRIIFVMCNTGLDTGFFQTLANALRVTVQGSSTGVEWKLDWYPEEYQGKLPYKGKPPYRRITRRGLPPGFDLDALGTAYIPKSAKPG